MTIWFDGDTLIAETIAGFYDFDGKRISQPHKRRHPSFKGRPMGSFISQPLNLVCRNLDEIRAFLLTCRYVSDQEQFGVKDHWMPPQEFEKARKGDCDDFALWTWKQLVDLGYNARFVAGRAGRYRIGHAWVSLSLDGRIYIVEPTIPRYTKFPRLDTLTYRPVISVEATGSVVKFFEHAWRTNEPPFRVLAPLVPEWLVFRLRILPRLLLHPFLALRRHYQYRLLARAARTG